MAYESKDSLVERLFTSLGKKAADMFEYEPRSAAIRDLKSGETIFGQEGLIFPKGYSQTSVNIVANKYFAQEVPEIGRETDIRQMVNRVTSSLRNYGAEHGYFRDDNEAETFQEELSFMILNQMYSPNSPTWFNAGKGDIYGIKGSPENGLYYFNHETGQIELADTEYEHPQCSACFILGLEDKLFGEDGIVDWWNNEVRLFKYGSGSGLTLQNLRAIGEKLSGGGQSSGAQSFALVSDRIADVVKSGGITRRAAKMVIQHYQHPEVLDFINWKIEAEKQVRALVAAGLYDPIEAYKFVSGQNSNNSVRVDDRFMEAVLNGGLVEFIERTTGQVRGSMSAEEMLIKIAAATHISGDPGLQYDDIIQKFNTVKNSGDIMASNPCSEYMFLNNSACNLGSLNLKKFVDENGRFDIEAFQHAVRIGILAQEIIVDYAGYPSEKIAENSHLFRPLGIGYANLGALLMSRGIPYDSEYGRKIAGAITGILNGTAYEQSARLAKRMGAFEKYEENQEPFMEVMELHKGAAERLDVGEKVGAGMNLEELIEAARESHDKAIELGKEHGFRNAQTTLLAPTGTIGFLMGCDTTGIEPEFMLVKYKNLVGGGQELIVNGSVREALINLGYSESETESIVQYMTEKGVVEGAPYIKEEHLSVFDSAKSPVEGGRFIEPLAHIKMMEAVQPFLSGAISKTVNVPNEAGVMDIFNLYVEGWKRGLKSLAIYRDGSKLTQPLVNGNGTIDELVGREKLHLNPKREGVVQVVKINTGNGLEYKVHLITGEYPDGKIGEIRFQLSKQGTTLRTVYDNFGIAVSEALKWGTPLESIAQKYIGSKSDISGVTDDPLVRSCTSLEDWAFRRLVLEYAGVEKYKELTGDFNFKLDPEIERNLRVNRNKQIKNAIAYFDDIADIEQRMSLKNLEEVQEYDNKKARKVKNKKVEGRLQENKPMVATGDTCDCGGQLIQDGKCKKCINREKVAGGCAT